MKLICLNIWGGRAGADKLLAFLDSHRDADFVCLQEVWSAPYDNLEGALAGTDEIDHAEIMVYGKHEIGALLGGHEAFFHPNHLNDYGLMTLVSRSLDVVESGDVFVHRERGYAPQGNLGLHARNLQFVTVDRRLGPLSVLNFHGL
jgi:Endonuclease/Exonuclease/phosphatase family